MSEALVTVTVTDEQIELVKRTVAEGANAEELRLFLFDCQRQGIHPLDRLLHFSKRGGRYTPITSIDLMRTRAESTGECAGIDDPVFTYKPNELVIPVLATEVVWRFVQGQRCPFTASARWSEYYPGDKEGFMWRKMPHTMLGKCAEALALRKAFPKQLQGLYAKEEMDQAERDLPRIPKAQSDQSGHDDRGGQPGAASGAARAPAAGGPTIDMAPAALFATAEDEERKTIVADIQRLVIKLKLREEAKATYRTTYLGGADVFDATVDIVSLKELVNALRARAGEPKA